LKIGLSEVEIASLPLSLPPFLNTGQKYTVCPRWYIRARETFSPGYSVISKKGSNALRYALFQGAVIASSRNNYFIQYFTNTPKGREKERGIKIKMRVKLAAKLLIIAWTIMKTKKAFDPVEIQTNFPAENRNALIG